MIVQIRGAGFVNKGAELMLISVINRLRDQFPLSQPAIDSRLGTIAQRRALGLKDLYWMEYHPKPGVGLLYNSIVSLLTALPSKRGPVSNYQCEGSMGLIGKLTRGLRYIEGARTPEAVLGRDVDLVLDLSGFAYGDPWGVQKTEFAARYFEQVKNRGGHVVLMPQQLGPFEKSGVRSAFRELSGVCDLIFARDRVSFSIAKDVALDPDVVYQCPDFTVLQKGVMPEHQDLQGKACIIPNFKMLKETPPEVRDAYPVFLRRCTTALRERGAEPMVLIHEQSGLDHEIAKRLSTDVGGVRIVDEQDPLRVKGIIGASILTIGSRFHGLVSALSQGVPSLGTGWSHKYRMLFEEYGCPENLVSPTLKEEQLSLAMDRILCDNHRRTLSSVLQEQGRRHTLKVERMWGMIQSEIEQRVSGDGGHCVSASI